jgi:hypothetical protein
MIEIVVDNKITKRTYSSFLTSNYIISMWLIHKKNIAK